MVAGGADVGARMTPRKAAPARSAKEYSAKAAEAGALWCAKTQKGYGWTGSAWELDETYKVQYTPEGNIATQDITDYDGYIVRETYTWNENNKMTSRLSQASDGEDKPFTDTQRLAREYDSRVTSFITSNVQEINNGGTWVGSNCYTQTLTRNADGNVTLMERAVLFQGIYDPIHRLNVEYGSDGKASSITTSDLGYNYSTGEYYWQTGRTYTDIEWENTDGQIVSVDDLFTGANRLKKAAVTTANGSFDLTVVYGEDGGYTATMVYPEGNQLAKSTRKYTPTGACGSCVIVTTSEYLVGSTVYTEIYTETNSYDDYGLILLEQVEFSDGNITELDSRTVGTVEYDSTNGYPLEWTIQIYDYDEDEMINDFRCEYSDYVDASAGITDIEAGEDGAAAEYYNLQGIRVSEPAAGGVYIRRCGGETVKVFVK